MEEDRSQPADSAPTAIPQPPRMHAANRLPACCLLCPPALLPACLCLQGDFFSLHMPLTPNTKGMFNDDAFGKVGGLGPGRANRCCWRMDKNAATLSASPAIPCSPTRWGDAWKLYLTFLFTCVPPAPAAPSCTRLPA